MEGVNDENARELTKSACFPSSLFQDSTDGLSKQLMEEMEGLGLEEATTLPSATETIDEVLVERPKPPIGRMAPNVRTRLSWQSTDTTTARSSSTSLASFPAAFVQSTVEGVSDEASTTSEAHHPRIWRDEKLPLPELKIAPKKLHDISNIIENQTQRGSATPDNAGTSKHPVSQTPSPSSYRNIGYVSASPTPEKGSEEVQQDVLQLTPEPNGNVSRLQVGSPEYMQYFQQSQQAGEATPQKSLDFDQEFPVGGTEVQASPVPAFESILDDTDESLMQAILDAEA